MIPGISEPELDKYFENFITQVALSLIKSKELKLMDKLISDDSLSDKEVRVLIGEIRSLRWAGDMKKMLKSNIPEDVIRLSRQKLMQGGFECV